MQSQKWQNDFCSFPRQTILYHSNSSLCPTSNAEEAEVEWFYEDIKDLLELTPPQKNVLFIIEDLNAKVGCQEIPGITVKRALGSITMNKASGRDEIPVELFQILEDDAVKVLHSIYHHGKFSSDHSTRKGQFSF